MPEGPEAHTIANKLNSQIAGLIIEEVVILPGSKHMDLDYLPLPLLIESVKARGKRPVIITNKGYISVFLAMTGSLTWQPTTHPRIIFKLSKGKMSSRLAILDDEKYYLHFNDVRPFGKVFYLRDNDAINDHFKPFGVDLISTNVTLDDFKVIVMRAPNNWEICKFLLCPKYFSSIGNYVKSEILYLSRIRPNKQLIEFTEQDYLNLYNATIWVLKTSVQSGGLTISDYRHPDGSVGTYSTFVYMKTVDSYGNEIVKGKFTDGRTTHWVPSLQR